MDKKDIVCMFPLEVLSRELDAKIYLGLCCIQQGLRGFFIGRKRQVMHQALGGEYNYILLDKGASHDLLRFEQVEKSGGVLVLLDEEGGVYSKILRKLWKRGGSNNQYLSRYRKIFFWAHEVMEEYLSNHPAISPSIPMVSGHPRFDLSKRKFNQYYKDISKIEKPIGDYVQINTLFALYNGFISLDEEVALWEGQPNFEEKKKFIIETYKAENEGFHSYIELVKKISMAFPKVTFVLRPHPAERMETYSSEFSRLANVMVSKEGSSKEWEAEALLVIHPGCTTAIEAAINGKDILFYFPGVDPDCVQTVPREISIKVETVQQIEELIARKLHDRILPLESEVIIQKHKDAIKKVVDNVDYDAGNKIAGQISVVAESIEFNKPVGTLPKPSLLARSIKSMMLYCPEFIWKFVKNAKGCNDVQQRRFMEKFLSLSKADVVKRINAFVDIFEEDLPVVKVKKVDKDTFFVYRK